MATQATYTLVSPPTPGLDPPAGVIPTFHQPYTLLPYAEVTIALCGIITTFLVAARLYVKIFILKKLLWEDFTCILGWVGIKSKTFPEFYRPCLLPHLFLCASRDSVTKLTESSALCDADRCRVSGVTADSGHLHTQARRELLFMRRNDD